MSAETKWLIGIALALAGLILQQSASLRAEMRDLRAEVRTELQALDSRLQAVEQVQGQHGLLLQLLAQRVLGMDADLPLPAETTGPRAEEREDGIDGRAALGPGQEG